MKILSFNNKGFTLFEMLATMLVLASVATITLIAFQPAFGSASLNYAAAILSSDLKGARRYARLTKQAAIIRLHEDGYVIDALSVSRSFPRGVRLDFGEAQELIFVAGGLSAGAELVLDNGRRSAVLRVMPLVGRISQYE